MKHLGSKGERGRVHENIHKVSHGIKSTLLKRDLKPRSLGARATKLSLVTVWSRSMYKNKNLSMECFCIFDILVKILSNTKYL